MSKVLKTEVSITKDAMVATSQQALIKIEKMKTIYKDLMIQKFQEHFNEISRNKYKFLKKIGLIKHSKKYTKEEIENSISYRIDSYPLSSIKKTLKEFSVCNFEMAYVTIEQWSEYNRIANVSDEEILSNCENWTNQELDFYKRYNNEI